MNSEFQLLFPLNRFYAKTQQPDLDACAVSPDEVPEPYRQLLCGNHDMTPTLEAFHKGSVVLRVLERWQEGEALWRLVVLERESDGRPVEFGAIVIHLSLFPKAARELVLEGHCPLGSILALHHMKHSSRPMAFLRAVSDATINRALKLEGRPILYGRRNVLRDGEGRALADILEILPPATPPTL